MSEVTFQEIQAQKETAQFKARIEKLERKIEWLTGENNWLKERHERERKRRKLDTSKD